MYRPHFFSLKNSPSATRIAHIIYIQRNICPISILFPKVNILYPFRIIFVLLFISRKKQKGCSGYPSQSF